MADHEEPTSIAPDQNQSAESSKVNEASDSAKNPDSTEEKSTYGNLTVDLKAVSEKLKSNPRMYTDIHETAGQWLDMHETLMSKVEGYNFMINCLTASKEAEEDRFTGHMLGIGGESLWTFVRKKNQMVIDACLAVQEALAIAGKPDEMVDYLVMDLLRDARESRRLRLDSWYLRRGAEQLDMCMIKAWLEEDAPELEDETSELKDEAPESGE